MSPFLEKETPIEAVLGRKYVSVFNRIYYAGKDEGFALLHADLVRMAAEKLGIPLKDIPKSEQSKPLVDAAGEIVEVKRKIAFGIGTTSCKIEHNYDTAQKMVNKLAVEILGEEKVSC